MDLDAAVIELYGLAPEDFTAARNQLAKTARDAGDERASTTLKALRKPTLAAWLANQLVRIDPAGIDDLTTLGEELQAAHLSGDGARVRELTRVRRNLVRSLVKTARAHAESLGRPVSEPAAVKLTETLEAALVDRGAAQLLRTGQLTSAMRHVGFGVVDEAGDPAQMAPLKPRVVRTKTPKPTTPPKTPARTAEKPRTVARRKPAADQALQRRRAELRTLAEEAEAEYADAEAQRAEAEAQLDANQHQISDLETRIERLTEELEQAREQLRLARRETQRKHRALDRATRNAASLQRRRDASRQRLANAES
jgi:hypothetical protein